MIVHDEVINVSMAENRRGRGVNTLVGSTRRLATMVWDSIRMVGWLDGDFANAVPNE